MYSNTTSSYLRKFAQSFFSVFAILLIELFSSNANAQNLTGNPWQSWVPEISNGAETPKAAFAYTSTNGKLTATINNTCESYGIGNDRRGYIFYANMTTNLIYCVEPATETVVSTFGFTSGGAKIVSPHSFKSFYVEATNKHYLVVSNSGPSPVIGLPGTINTDGIVTILDVTNPAAMVFEKNIVVPAALATGSRATGMDIIQTAYTSAGVSLYIVVDNLRVGPFGGGLITVADPLNATPAITVFLTRDGLGTTNFSPHSVLADAVNSRLYVSGSDYNFILSFTLTGTPTYNTYRPLDGDGNEPAGLHTMMLNKAGTLLYAGSVNDAGGNKAYTFTVQSDKTPATVTTINQTAKSDVLNYGGSTSGNVMGVNLLPDGSKLYGVLEYNGSGNTAKIYDLDPATLATNTIIKNKAGTADATFGYLDPHSYAFTLQDFGDAPASYGRASHFLLNDDYLQDRLRIGATIDGDSAIVYSPNFDGDNSSATPKNNDEDGITSAITSSAPGLYYGMAGTYSINGIEVKNTTVPAVTANLLGWIDFNHDGVFQSTEGASVSVPNGTTSVDLSWTIPANVSTGPVLLRLRLSSDPSLTLSTASSAVFDGEAEDHKFPASITVSGSVFGDANGNTIFGTAGTSASGENGTTAGVSLYAYLIINGIIIDSAEVSATGEYNFLQAPQNAGSATVVIGTNSLAPGTASSSITNIATDPPADWVFIGSSSKGTSYGNANALSITLGTTGITNQNFGIEQIPVADIKTQIVAYPVDGGIPAGSVTTAVSGTDAEDGILGNSNTMVITTVPAGGTIMYYDFGSGPVTIVAGQTITGFNPSMLSFSGIPIAATQVVFNYAFVDAANKQGAAASYTLNWLTLIPLKLENFAIKSSACDKAELAWKISGTVNFSHFEIERSFNGNPFQTSSTVLYTSGSVSYTIMEANLAAGQYQYRLKMVDVDGKSQYSSIVFVSLNCNGERKITVYPNPVKEKITVNGLKGGEQIVMYNAAGQQVYNKKTIAYQLSIDMTTLTTGTYYIKITDKNGEKINELKIAKYN